MRERPARQAKNEALHREVNERIEKVDEHAGAGWAKPDHLFDFLCECGEDDCFERVTMTLAEYEQLRQQDDRFAVVPGHENTEIETVVEAREDRYLIVDKIPAVEPYVADDPRGAPSS
jgi:hypothetical protein